MGGMPFVLSFLNIHTRREVHQVIYERIFNWVGPEVMTQPPHIVKLKKVPKESSKNETNGADEDDDANDDESDDDDKDKKEKKIEYDYIRPSKEAMEEYEA